MGYQACDVDAGDAMINPSFIPVGGGSILVSDIKVEGAVGTGDVSMQNMNPDGTWADKTYYYLTEAGTGYVPDGWYLDMWGDEPVSSTDVLEFGHGMSLTSSFNDLELTYSGAVKSGVPVVDWDQGDGFLGNPTPVTQKFDDIQIEGAVGTGDVSCQKMNPDGTWAEKTYYYLTLEGTGYVADGWYLDMWGDTPVTDEDYLAAGESICLTNSFNDITISFKKVID